MGIAETEKAQSLLHTTAYDQCRFILSKTYPRDYAATQSREVRKLPLVDQKTASCRFFGNVAYPDKRTLSTRDRFSLALSRRQKLEKKISPTRVMEAVALLNDSDSEPSWLAAAMKQKELEEDLNFKKGAGDENTNDNASTSAEDEEKEKKRRFNAFIRSQTAASEEGNVEAEIAALEGALVVRPDNGKVQAKLEKLKRARAEEIASQLKVLTRTHVQKDLPAPITVDGFKHRPGSSSYQLPGKYKLPAEVFEKLFKYQRDGVRWMWELYRHERGGLLADDMGLGKTVQVAAFLRGLFVSKHIETVLIVMPKSLIENWRKELTQWTQRLVCTYDGTKRQREHALEEVARLGGIVLTTYGMIRTNAAKLTGIENPVSGDLEEWDYVILDEGHKIKNASSEGAKGIRQIAAAHKLVLTGTPILNHLLELWALYDYIEPGLLGDLNYFRKGFDEPIVRASHKNAKAEHKMMGEEVLAQLKKRIGPHFLRRIKDEVFSQRINDVIPAIDSKGKEEADGDTLLVDPHAGETSHQLSDRLLLEKHRISVRKNDLIVWVSLSPVQLELYDKFLFLPEVKEILNTSKSPLAAITVIKKICQHPRLLHAKMKTLREHAEASGAPAEGGLASLLAKLAAGPQDVVAQSGKLQFMALLLDNLLQQGHRVLIFSQWQKMLDIIGQVLAERQVAYYRIDGSITKPEERQRLIDQFNRGGSGAPNVFLLTTQTGGLGITLTGADRAIIYDPAWNTSDDQAVDRIYRIGQKRNCVIYRLITCGTVEEKIYRKQVFKGGLSRMVSSGQTDDSSALSASDIGFRYFTKDELRALFTLENPYESLTQQQLESKHASRRNTDAELDDHLKFLSTIGNFHGVSDHDLLYDGDASSSSTAVSSKNNADGTDEKLRGIGRFIDSEANEVDKSPRDSDANASVVLDAMSVTLGDDDAMDRSMVAEDDEDENDSFVVPDDHVEWMDENDEEEPENSRASDSNLDRFSGSAVKEPRVQDKKTEILYVGPRSAKLKSKSLPRWNKSDSAHPKMSSQLSYSDSVNAAKVSEEQGDLVEALNQYMDAFESDQSNPKLVQKIMYLRNQVEEAVPSVDEINLINDDEDDDDDVEIFDDEMDDVTAAVSTLVIDSPVVALKQAKQQQVDESMCCVCMENPKNTCFVPCGHVATCPDCSEILEKKEPSKCPMCRATFTMTMRVYL